MAQRNDHPYVEKRLKPGWYMFWKRQTYRIVLPEKYDPLTLSAENTTTSEVRPFSFTELWRSDCDDDGPIFAPTLEQLRRKIDKRHPAPDVAPTTGIPAENLARADYILSVVEQVKQLLPTAQAQLEEERKEKEERGEPTREATNTDVLRAACALVKPKPIRLSTLYKYRGCVSQHHGDRSAIAASFRRSTFRKMKLDTATLHFLDTIIPLYCGRKRPAEIYDLGESALEHRTHGLWLDPAKSEGPIPADLVSELKQVLDRKLPMQALLENTKKSALLSKIEMPALGLFYNYHRWFLAQPDKGRKALNESYGEGTWESFFTIFDSFAYRATFPLQYVFADHYLVDVFTVDKATRSKLDRLWLTVLIDAYTRCILGAVLLYEEPCIESIQSALLHAIWPKSSHTHYGIDKDWACFGIPQQLFLDNALAHHSHSLENLARQISFQGQFQTIDLVFRPPYMARYGALIESFFGHLSGRIKQDLPGAIPSSKPRDLRKAAREACLLYEDIDRYIQQFILKYQHDPHKALGGMTPHDKWMESVEGIGLPQVPGLGPKVRRLFLREATETRPITDKGVCFLAMHYTAEDLSEADRIEINGSDVEYSIRYDRADISTISIYDGAVFKGELKAKELRLPDGSLKRTSEWELKMAKALAKQNDGSREDWLSYLNDAEEIEKQRRAERDRIRRQRKRLAQEEQGEDERAKIEEKVEDMLSDDDEFLTKQLAVFQS